jgi:hypothetical protein
MRIEYLRSMTETLVVEELGVVSPALVVPLGRAAEACVRHALRLNPFHRARQFAGERQPSSRAVEASGLARRSDA